MATFDKSYPTWQEELMGITTGAGDFHAPHTTMHGCSGQKSKRLTRIPKDTRET